METSVPPPSPGQAADVAVATPPERPSLLGGGPRRPDQLTPAWRLVVLLTWVGVVLAYLAVWKSSRELGLSTWWLGPVAAPRPVPIMLLPLVAPIVMIVLTVNNARWLPLFGLGASAIGFAIAFGDLTTFRRLGLVELGIAVAGTLVSVASLAGRYRAVGDR